MQSEEMKQKLQSLRATISLVHHKDFPAKNRLKSLYLPFLPKQNKVLLHMSTEFRSLKFSQILVLQIQNIIIF